MSSSLTYGQTVKVGFWHSFLSFGVQFPLALLLLTIASLDAVHALRPLYADGASYFYHVLENQGFSIIEPSRKTIQFIQQLPLVISLELGLDDIYVLAVIFGFSKQFTPILLLIFCYLILPEEKRTFILLPLLNLLVGWMSTSFAAIGEGSIAVSYFWLLFYFLLFRSSRLDQLFLIMMLSVLFVYAHENTIFLAPILLITAAWKAVESDKFTNRIVLLFILSTFILTIYVQLNFILEPRSFENRDAFLGNILVFRWIYFENTWNLPAALGMASLIALFLLHVQNLEVNGQQVFSSAAKLAWAILALGVVIVGWQSIADFMDKGSFNPISQFIARNHPAFVSFFLALVAGLGMIRPQFARTWENRGNFMVIAALTVSVVAWHTAATKVWSGYVADFRQLLAADSGYVSWDQAVASLPGDKAGRFDAMSWAWTTPLMSLSLAPDGQVSTIIGNKKGLVHYRFDPLRGDDLPKTPLFDTRNYAGIVGGRGLLR